MANKGLKGFPTKNVIILVVTVTGKGPYPRYRDEILPSYIYDINQNSKDPVINQPVVQWCEP